MKGFELRLVQVEMPHRPSAAGGDANPRLQPAICHQTSFYILNRSCFYFLENNVVPYFSLFKCVKMLKLKKLNNLNDKLDDKFSSEVQYLHHNHHVNGDIYRLLSGSIL